MPQDVDNDRSNSPECEMAHQYFHTNQCSARDSLTWLYVARAIRPRGSETNFQIPPHSLLPKKHFFYGSNEPSMPLPISLIITVEDDGLITSSDHMFYIIWRAWCSFSGILPLFNVCRLPLIKEWVRQVDRIGVLAHSPICIIFFIRNYGIIKPDITKQVEVWKI